MVWSGQFRSGQVVVVVVVSISIGYRLLHNRHKTALTIAFGKLSLIALLMLLRLLLLFICSSLVIVDVHKSIVFPLSL